MEEAVVVAPAQPVGDDMVRFSRNDDPNVNPARCGLVEGCDNVVIGDEVAWVIQIRSLARSMASRYMFRMG
ncbi:hypothetical protein JCM18918_3262 [Cutibacterium acnes JCM 18918]|nr:hypothetical protein JCM18918_3262 [Cutibacterium acnes JCM 18918]